MPTASIAALDRLDDDELWRIARGQRSEIDSIHLQDLLEKNAEAILSADERLELEAEIYEADRFMLRKAHAASLLQWRGHAVPPINMNDTADLSYKTVRKVEIP